MRMKIGNRSASFRTTIHHEDLPHWQELLVARAQLVVVLPDKGDQLVAADEPEVLASSFEVLGILGKGAGVTNSARSSPPGDKVPVSCWTCGPPMAAVVRLHCTLMMGDSTPSGSRWATMS